MSAASRFFNIFFCTLNLASFALINLSITSTGVLGPPANNESAPPVNKPLASLSPLWYWAILNPIDLTGSSLTALYPAKPKSSSGNSKNSPRPDGLSAAAWYNLVNCGYEKGSIDCARWSIPILILSPPGVLSFHNALPSSVTPFLNVKSVNASV